MRTVVAICAVALTFGMTSSAAERVWQEAVWGPRTNGQYLLETSREIVTASATADTGDLPVTPGGQVQVAIEGRVVYVRQGSGPEHSLALTEAVLKHSSDYRAVGSGHYITSVAPGGAQVVLEDGSRWDIDPRQQFAVTNWQAEDLIAVRRADDEEKQFVFELDNTTQDNGTLANYRIR